MFGRYKKLCDRRGEEEGKKGEEKREEGNAVTSKLSGWFQAGTRFRAAFAFLWSISIRTEWAWATQAWWHREARSLLQVPSNGMSEKPPSFGKEWSMMLLENSFDVNWPVLAHPLKFWNQDSPPSLSCHFLWMCSRLSNSTFEQSCFCF